METNNVFAILAGIFSISAYIPYVLSILRKKTKPAIITWIIWFILDVLLLVSYIKSGAGKTTILLAAYTLGSFVISFLAIRYGIWTGLKSSLPYFILSLIGIILWIMFSSAELGLYSFMTVLIISSWPTFKKAYKDPWGENIYSWIMWGIGSFFATISLGNFSDWTFSIALIPVIFFVCNIPITGSILLQRRIVKKP